MVAATAGRRLKIYRCCWAPQFSAHLEVSIYGIFVVLLIILGSEVLPELAAVLIEIFLTFM
jgi:hypothetical protein